MPIPPYIRHTRLTESIIRRKYQAIFARHKGAVVAPTASLHFTERLMDSLTRAKIQKEFITLHVGLGTFAPLTAENLSTNRLHEEEFSIDPATAARLTAAKKEGRPIIAVGTTVVRALESAAQSGRIAPARHARTSLFINEKNPHSFVTGIITNFHVPRSSLLMLVSSFIPREELLKLYSHAIKNRFRLFSFGDGMLIL